MQCAHYKKRDSRKLQIQLHSTYIHIVCILSLLQMLATNTSDMANWFMHARVTVYMHSYSYIAILAIWWLIDHDAQEASSYT